MIYNGKQVSIEENTTLDQFIQINNYDIKKIAVELNLDIIPKLEYKNIILKDSDKLEVVSFVGGG
ncbi:thiamine biosynthesis protein ThiS [Candidatus Epulonipiscium fishelsonii]|uniref:Thiamine biosynthesis protein ThiS n=1 Tax=Candidatus Epulonipiscium fishelsonii TaxID=77094 RepID=A0ACC8XBI2_9FIRM|nr:thiamine biosynthesis protein ThiS [Epulopiscium sp. SCG-B11WGA-EpuloA1]ONI41272.1 thiamine biosynthesis protein ThiS [Epulopiscium sp. SCG-B05WGA-EpuloA1]